MSHWHLRPESFFYKAATLALLASSIPCSAFAADSSLGPVSEAESAILWKDSQKYYKTEDCENALSRLKRLVDRYPGYPSAEDYRKARFELGHCYYEQKQDGEAIKTLKTYLEGPGDHPDAERAREMIGLAQLRTKKLHEAYLTSEELQKSESLETQAKALLLRSQVWIARNQNGKAKASTVSALALADQSQSKPLLAQARTQEFEILTRECALPSAKKSAKDEARVRKDMETRGTCLTEALIQFRKALAPEHTASAERATLIATQAFKDYRRACENPPNPPKLQPKDRTAEQLKSYKVELADHLTQIYETHRKAALQMISNWKQENPPPSEFVQRRLQILEESLK
ncbi:MAG: outer membrane protein assembly factor BamD [Bdellovibrionia bacterium]